jgi:hypothetical protein
MVTFRAIVPEDALLLADWLRVDELHKEIPAGFFMEHDPERGTSCFAIEDEEGPVIFARQEVEGEAIRLHAEFPQGRKRVARALLEAYPIVAADLKNRGFKFVRFDLQNAALVKIMIRAGFRAELVADL